MNRVITIGREFGSGGRELGKRLAEALGIAYYDKEVLTGMVEKTSFSENYINEVVETKNHRIFAPASETFGTGTDFTIKQIQDVFRAQTEVIREMAAKGDCVIVGRCADYILKDADVKLWRLFVYADMDSRVKRCMERATEDEDLNEKEMRRQIQKVDRGRAHYYEDYTLQKWGDKSNYDICVNTSNMDIAEMVPHLAKIFTLD